MVRPSEVRWSVVWLLVLSACCGRGCVGVWVVGCCCLVENDIQVEGCAALTRALEGGAVPQLSTLNLFGM